MKKLWGILRIDLVEFNANFKVKRFISYYPEPMALGADAFAIPWGDKIFYEIWPFCLLNRVIQKTELEKAEWIDIVSIFTTQPWFSKLMKLLIKIPVKLPSNHLFSPYRKKNLPQLSQMKMVTCYLSADRMKCRALLEKLQMPLLLPGERGPTPNMIPISDNRLNIATMNVWISLHPL